MGRRLSCVHMYESVRNDLFEKRSEMRATGYHDSSAHLSNRPYQGGTYTISDVPTVGHLSKHAYAQTANNDITATRSVIHTCAWIAKASHSSPSAKMAVIAILCASRSCNRQMTQWGIVQVRRSSATPSAAMVTTKGSRLKQCPDCLSGRVQLYLIGRQCSRMPRMVARHVPMAKKMQPYAAKENQQEAS